VGAGDQQGHVVARPLRQQRVEDGLAGVLRGPAGDGQDGVLSTSVLISGSSFTGGAHPNPLTASFVAHSSDNRLVAIGDLFGDETAAIKILSDEARAQLQGRFEAQLREQLGEGDALEKALKDMREWVERGTEPKAENFAVYLVDGLDSKAIGLTLVFPPYQVAPYVDGAPQVEVPARLFHSILKPEYVAAFHWDTEAEKNGQH